MSLSRHLFLSGMQRFIKKDIYHFKGQLPLEEECEKYRSIDLKKWPKAPQHWLSQKDCLMVGMALAFNDPEKAMLYMNDAIWNDENAELTEYAKFAEAITLFREAVRSGHDRISWIRLARKSLGLLQLNSKDLKELALMYMALCYAAEGNIELATNSLSKAAKIQNNPQINAMLSNIYRRMGLFSIAHFFQRRVDRVMMAA
ncbi:MAG: hypothetical protein COW00_18780 [Bdellovibrio sp. CG12_big_fil_rev_8_21_14_0_65_39_13]|nr:MAG: hypothetical protein COW78_05850 [Bdellovibrio sp. CG22_combo_CG10-13_8_21_14_all_39_27]PIQ57745.1 MAG: hypothetical protein COW00_18780 [Bdellovibrio sp. CG12_big_fil_rev_8_21_14_0_65_39_13]PIR34975.1 MAG: hypothetical protein COV37_10875 [Bdellovibrio sp. CG11_big_fil_rev_8_21_14_0_20_39_38]PJB53026.1 MAG: hypothetical protein CO099_09480 [Bdellovibrio sp. CG_4_9_14_3_um_filter_39_7]